MTETTKGAEVTEFQIKVKNIPWETTQEEVEQFLKSITSDESVHQVKLLVNQKSGRSKGYAYAKLTDQAAFDKALSATNLKLRERQLQIVPAKTTKSLYIGNLPKNITEEQIREFFQNSANIEQVQLIANKSNEFLGFGYVDFNNNEAAQAALQQNGQNFNGQEVKVEYKRQRPRRQQQQRRGGNRQGNPERRGDNDRNGYQRRNNDRQNDRDYDRRENRGQQYRQRNDRNERQQKPRNEEYQKPRNEVQQKPRNEVQQKPRNEVQQRPQNESSSSIYVGNLSFKTTEQQLIEFFEQSGPVANVNIVVDRYSGRSRGYGFVNFQHPNDAKDALKFDNENLDGRNIKVDLQQSRQNNRSNYAPRGDYAPRGGDRRQYSGQRYQGGQSRRGNPRRND